MNFSNYLLQWYLQNKRTLPWRETQNPYIIWLSEIMLQQTRVAQALPYFLTFVEHFPTVFDLAKSNEEQVLKLWQGLGYYSRARNMHKTAQIIAFEQNGIFPDNYNDLLKLKGIGEYTAAAIASISFNENVAVVDGNVFRVLSRYFGITTDIALETGKKEFRALAQQLIDGSNPATFNQAIMEFGALQCVPKNPKCDNCIFNNKCVAFQKNKVNELPVKSKKAKATQKHFNYLVFIDKEKNTSLNKRTQKGIWQNLYEFPMIETTNEVDYETLCQMVKQEYESNSINFISPYTYKPIIHKLTHQTLNINFYKIEVETILNNKIQIDKINELPFPIVIHNFIEKYIKKELN